MYYPITVGEVAFVKTTDEAVFVLTQPSEQGEVVVRRKIEFEYSNDTFLESELVSEKQRLIRELDFLTFSLAERDRYSQRFEASRTQVSKDSGGVKPGPSGGSLLN